MALIEIKISFLAQNYPVSTNLMRRPDRIPAQEQIEKSGNSLFLSGYFKNLAYEIPFFPFICSTVHTDSV